MFAYCLNNPICYADPVGQRRCSVLPEVEELLHKMNDLAVDLGVDTAELGAQLLDMYEGDPGVYHTYTDCWQQYMGYNNLYDFFFDLGTSMESNRFKFGHNGVEYIIWVWKGDYINLGAGAELGIYVGGDPHWSVDTSLAMPMSVSLSYNSSTIISHSQTTWWITGFNSNYLNVQASTLTATYSIDFSGNPGMFNSFHGLHKDTPGWSFNTSGHIATYRF